MEENEHAHITQMIGKEERIEKEETLGKTKETGKEEMACQIETSTSPNQEERSKDKGRKGEKSKEKVYLGAQGGYMCHRRLLQVLP